MAALDEDMHDELEHDMQGGEALSAAAGAFGDADLLDDEEDCACCVEETEAEDGGCCDEEDPLAAPLETEAEEAEDEAEEDAPVVGGADEGEAPEGGAEQQESTRPAKKKKKARSSKAKAQPAGARLEELARPRPPRAETSAEIPKPAAPVPEKKPQTTRPSLLLRLRPTNLEEAMEAFFASGFSEAPQFTYAFPEDYVQKHFEDNSNVDFELLPEAKRILQRVQDEYGGPEPFMQRLYGDVKVSAEDLRDMVATYLQEHNIEDKVEIRIVDNMLAAANVVKPSPDEKYVVNIARGPISKNMVQGICDHEVGTHLLRMMNDEYQVWHGRRDRYRLLNPWTTEEGFATLNTYISMPSKLLYPQALRYFAVCRGAQVGFVELFHELREHVSDPKRCWQMCCRIKRGQIDTSQPGAFYMDQAYFKGAVEILRHLNEIDFGRLYAGQIALQDMDKVYFLLRKEVVRLPRFLNTPEKLKTYMAHCRRLIKENQIEAAVERVCKPVFIRAAKEFFKTKPKAELRATIAIGAPGPQVPGADGAKGAGKTLDLSRIEDLAKPRPAPAAEADAQEAKAKKRDCDLTRLASLAMPRARTEGDEFAASKDADGAGRAPDLARIGDLARPRQLALLSGPSAEASDAAGAARREFSKSRMLELAAPKLRSSTEAAPADAPQGAAPKPRTAARRGASAPPPSEGTGRPPASADGRSEAEGDAANADSEGESGDDEAAAPLAARKTRRRRRRSRSKDVPSPPPPPPPERPPDVARLAALAQPRKACEEEQGGQPCQCAPKARRKRRKTKLRLLALVQERREQMEDQGDLGDSLLEPTPRDGDSSTPGADAQDVDEPPRPPTQGSAAAAGSELSLSDLPTPERSPLAGGGASAPAAGSHASPAAGSPSAPTAGGSSAPAAGSTSAPAAGGRAGSPSAPAAGGSSAAAASSPSAHAAGSLSVRATGSPSVHAGPAAQEPASAAKPRSQASQRALSLGARAVTAEMPTAAWQPLAFSSALRPPLPGGGVAGLGVARALGAADAALPAPATRKRTATSLPRPSAILPRAAMAAMATMATGNDGSNWKPVPIKTMQLQLAL